MSRLYSIPNIKWLRIGPKRDFCGICCSINVDPYGKLIPGFSHVCFTSRSVRLPVFTSQILGWTA